MATQTDKVIFYHIPKTGGIWVKLAMRFSGIKCGRARNKRRMSQEWKLKREHAIPSVIIPEDKEGRFSFCFIRHPIAWYKSFWAYRVYSAHSDPNFPLDKYLSYDFEEFVKRVLKAYPDGFVSQLYQFFIGKDGNEIDYIGRQENLLDDLIEALYLGREVFNRRKIKKVKRRNIAAARVELQALTNLSSETEGQILQAENWILEHFYGGFNG